MEGGGGVMAWTGLDWIGTFCWKGVRGSRNCYLKISDGSLFFFFLSLFFLFRFQRFKSCLPDSRSFIHSFIDSYTSFVHSFLRIYSLHSFLFCVYTRFIHSSSAYTASTFVTSCDQRCHSFSSLYCNCPSFSATSSPPAPPPQT